MSWFLLEEQSVKYDVTPASSFRSGTRAAIGG